MRCQKLILLLVPIIFIISCSKEKHETETIQNKNKASLLKSEKILVFSNLSEYIKTLKKVVSMTDEERKNWETSQGFRSFGITCDEIYKAANPESFNSIKQFNELVARNEGFIYLEKLPNNELSLEIVAIKNISRYLANSNRQFQIGTTVFKVMNAGVVSTSVDNSLTLDNIDDNNYHLFLKSANIEISDFVYGPKISNRIAFKSVLDNQLNCGDRFYDYQSSGNDRTYFELKCGTSSSRPWPSYYIRPYTNYMVWAKKRGAFFLPWVYVSRHIEMDMRTRVDFQATVNGAWISELITKHIDNYFGSALGDFEYGTEVPGFVTDGVHFGGSVSWAETPSAPRVNHVCNPSIVQ